MGNETFSNKTKYETDYQPRFLKIVDINNDNISDLIIGHIDITQLYI